MSKKKKNIRRKKSNNLLKGVAAAGAVVGGGTIFAGNNAVYAAEIDDETQVSNLSESQASTSTYMSESLSESDSTTVDYASIENSTNASVSASAYDSTVDSEKNSIVESDSISDSVSLSESQLSSTSESESISTSVSVSESESSVSSEALSNDKSSNKFGNLINGLLNGNKNVSAANYTTPTGIGSVVLTAESGSEEYSTSMSKYFSESTARSNSLTSVYGSQVAGEVLTGTSYIVEGDNDLIKEGVLVQKGKVYEYTYITNKDERHTIQLTKNNVKINSGNVTINWDGYWIKNDGTIEKTSSFTDYNEKSGNKVFMTMQDKKVYVVKKNNYWVPVKVNDNYVEVQNNGEKVNNENFRPTPLSPNIFVKIKIGNEYYYLDKAEYNDQAKKLYVLSWSERKYE